VLINQDRENKEAGITRGGRRQGDAGRYSASKVAFADFCLALPALFLVLWLMAARQQQSLAAIVRDAAGGAPQGQGDKHDSASVPKATLIERFPLLPGGHGPSNGNGGANRARMSYEPPAELAALSHALLSHALLSLSVDAGLSSNFSSALAPYGLRVMLHDTDRERMFMSDSPLPTPRLARLLQKMGPLFAQVQNQMLIVGHTDSVQYSDTGKRVYLNWSLSSKRQILILTRAQSSRVAAIFGEPAANSALPPDGAPDTAALWNLRRQPTK
jgi:chemotaxis protein MotB